MNTTSGFCAALRRLALVGCLAYGAAFAQTDAVSVAFLQGKAPVAPDAISTLGPDLFGDKINLFNGSFYFEQTDVDLPGNNALPVALVRHHTPGRKPMVRGAMADWDISTPRIEGTFAATEGWVPVYSNAANRCSGFSSPPQVTRGGSGAQMDFAAHEYWQGTNLVVPGHGSQEILKRSANYAGSPTAGGPYPLVTRNNWQIACLSGAPNAGGQGFVAVSPEGVRYQFDWMALRMQMPLRKGDAVLDRRDMFLMASVVTDRFGNWVRYTYDSGNRLNLTRIESSDGRLITLAYANGRVATVSDGTRSWQYVYSSQGDLQNVQLPDGSNWTFNLRPLVTMYEPYNDEYADCDSPTYSQGDPGTGTITHPSGAVGSFYALYAVHGRTNVQRACTYYPNSTWTNGAMWPRATSNQALMSKQISGPGMPAMTWAYSGDSNSPYGEWAPCNGCQDRKTVTVTEPNGSMTRHTFGISWRVNEGQLLQVDEGWDGTTALKTTVFNYRAASGQAYPDGFGDSVYFLTDYLSTRNRPQDTRVITQQGVDFNWQIVGGAAGFDSLARPVRVRMFSPFGDRTHITGYYDNFDLWALGQTASVTDAATNKEIERHDYVPTALRAASYAFGLKTATFTYAGDGTLATIADGAGQATTFQNFTRGKPQRAVFADQTVASRVVNNIGNVASITNEVGTSHGFQFDAMGRVSRIDYPAGDPVAYHPTLQNFQQVWSAEFGSLQPGHWKQTISTGNAVTERWFDAMWRVRLQRKYDAANPAGTSSYVETRYDGGGRKVFESYPTRTFGNLDDPQWKGTATEYDNLSRVVKQSADSELPTVGSAPGKLNTTTQYLTGFQREVTNPRGFSTRYAYQAFDTPAEDHIVSIWAPENVSVSIWRDIFHKPIAITRSGGGKSATRNYVYDSYERLCKTVEPESGATLLDYDGASNVTWRAVGTGLTGASCDRANASPARRISNSYDPRNRLTATSYGDGSASITRSYTPDGLLQQITTQDPYNPIGWAYSYNNHRLLTRERYTWGDPVYGWNFDRTVDANGHVSGLTDPWGAMGYAPNALGQPTQVSGYASNVSYHPNGSIASYTRGNGVAHVTEFNVRGLPQRMTNAGITQDAYTYDANGNITGITDEQEAVNNRSMPLYDGLDRLRQANGPWGAGGFDYDALDNLVASTVGGRSLSHNIDASTNRLASLSGSQTIGIGYDANGNVSQRGGQQFNFDISNRMQSAPGKVNYNLYDGHGRRNIVWFADGRWMHQAYTNDGKLRFAWRNNEGHTRHVYLGNHLIAETVEGGATTFFYTDALGSPIGRNTGSAAVERTRYEPYGATVVGSANPTKIGFTGHVNDQETGLVYMQQRYYEPLAGRFLSIDPVTTDAENGALFNRYMYAANNPFTFVDSDGRCTGSKITTSEGLCKSTGGFTTGSDGAALGMQLLKIADAALTGGLGLEALQAAEEGRPLAAAGYAAAALGVAGLTFTPIGAAARAGTAAKSFTAIVDLTLKGSRYANIGANIGAKQFQSNLLSNGYKVVKQTEGANGPVTVLSNGDKLYTIYTANSTGAASAQVTNTAGQILSKIRLQGP